MRKILSIINEKFAWVLVSVLIIILAFLSPLNLHPFHMLQTIKSVTAYALIALGQTLVVLTGCVDLSTGPLAVLTMLFTSQWARGNNFSLIWIIPSLIGIGVVTGLFNGVFVSFLKVEPMIMTLVTGTVLQGVYLLYTGGAPKGRIPPLIRGVATGTIAAAIPQAVVLLLVIAGVLWFLTKWTTLGRRVYYVGSSRRAAWLSGTNPATIIIIVYLVSSLLSILAGLVLGGSIGYGTLQIDVMDYSFFPLIITLIGGTNFVGAQGGVFNTIIGTINISLLLSIVILFRVPLWGKYFIQGLLILFALFGGRRKS